jgi:molybdopterin biosynthesis enzyme
MRTDSCFLPADQIAPAVAFNDWLRERVRSILDASPRRQETRQAPLSSQNA